MAKKILLVEDEPGMLMALEDRFKQEGYEVETESNGVRAEEKAKKRHYDLILLDIMLPGRDGLQICQNLRESAIQTPILFLTARSSDIDTIMGLRIGADDYLNKPFEMQVLLARVHALIRRSVLPKVSRLADGEIFTFGKFSLDTGKQELKTGETAVDLSVLEYRLLEFFLLHPDRVLSREVLLNEVWGYDNQTTTRTVDVHISWLRQKLGEKQTPKHIFTVRGYGYKFIAEG